MLDTHQQGFAKLVAMIEALDVGMLTTEDENGHLRSRPPATTANFCMTRPTLKKVSSR